MDEPWTQVPNDFIDLLMKDVNGGVCKVYLAICRKTIGWHKVSDKISYSQIKEMTGLEKASINEALKILESMDRIVIDRIKGKTNKIDLNFTPLHKVENTSSESEGVPPRENDHLNSIPVQKVNRTCLQSEQVTCSQSEHTKERRKETNKTNNIIASASLSAQEPPKNNSIIKSLIHDYSTAYFNRTTERVTIGWGQWGAAFKKWLRGHTASDIRKVMDRFFAYDKRTQFGFNKFQTAFDNLLPGAMGHVLRAGPAFGSWKCPHCGEMNTHTGSRCMRCRKDRDDKEGV